MSTSLLRGNLRFASIIIVAVILLLLIPGIALGQDNNQEVPSTEVEIEITDGGSGFFEEISTFVWILGILLLVVIILLVFFVGRSGNRGRE